MILVDLELKTLADRHGYLCPDLVIGWRVGLVARRYLGSKGTITAECLSCALDALKAMGPWKINVDPLKGRHIYRLLPDRGQVLVLEVPLDIAWPGGDFINLEERLSRCEASPKEIRDYHLSIDNQVSRILTASDVDLFSQRMSVQ
ncbi:MAG: hypothetical protein GWP10_02180 [Nitrospiraceae bacterium]|nr:hypothetical protein [Nitrospiraceae bacterium]